MTKEKHLFLHSKSFTAMHVILWFLVRTILSTGHPAFYCQLKSHVSYNTTDDPCSYTNQYPYRFSQIYPRNIKNCYNITKCGRLINNYYINFNLMFKITLELIQCFDGVEWVTGMESSTEKPPLWQSPVFPLGDLFGTWHSLE